MADFQLLIIRGLPGSGKTTTARKLAANGYDHHEADHYFERGDGYHFDPAKLREAHAECLRLVTESLRAGRPTVVSNTFTQQWEWQPYVDAARAAGASVRIIEARGNWDNVHGVPGHVIDKMRDRWEPTPAEFRTDD